MKKNAVIRIIVYSVLVLLLAGLLLAGITGSRLMAPLVFRFGDDSVQSGTQLPAEQNAATVPADGITDIEINWASGHVTFVLSDDTDVITVSETPNEKYAMVCYQSGQELRIDFSDKHSMFSFRPGKVRKDLTITVPSGWAAGEISLDSAATELSISGLSIDELEIDGASNRIRLTDCTVNSVSLDGASNDLVLEGSLQELDSDGASNHLTLELRSQPREISIDGVSTRLELTLPRDSGFTVDCDGLSIDLNTDFEVTSSRKNHYVSGDGSCYISVDGVSADLTIHKAP